MTIEVDFDALTVKTIESNGAMEDLSNLYGAAFALSEWLFIARGELPNVSPYIASNAQYADGQPMIRAFTDTKRLIRFAQENNLTKVDGTCDSLSIPTTNIIDYLEQFIASGAYGIWFNSDSQSEGFFVPLKQLRPIKEHLEKINRTNNTADSPSAPIESIAEPDAPADRFSTLMEENAELIAGYDEENMMLTATVIAFAGGMESLSKEEKAVRVSDCAKALDDLRGEYKMSPGLFEFFIEFCMEKQKFIIPVMAFGMCLRQEDKVKRLEQDEELNKELARWMTIKLVPSADILLPPADKPAERSSNLENWGLSPTPDGEVDLNLSINRVGAVNFDTSIAPFYQAIGPLLENYRGSGEYNKLLAFDPNGMSELVENIADNTHGAYLRVRRFLYLNPKNNVRIGVNSIHSNQMRHVQSNGTLLVSFELCKNLDNQTAAFYFAFLGARSEVEKLINAVSPLLASCEFKAIS